MHEKKKKKEKRNFKLIIQMNHSVSVCFGTLKVKIGYNQPDMYI